MPLLHVWFAATKRTWLLQGDVAEAARQIMIETAKEKSSQLLECEVIVDHVHLLLDLPQRAKLPRTMNDLKRRYCPAFVPTLP
jgi:REP element-mobilizing transposase RayT